MTITEAYAQFETHEQQYSKHKTRQNYKTALHSFTVAVGDLPVKIITYDHISMWQTYLLKTGKQKSTISSYLSTLREVFKWLQKRDINVLNPRDIDLPSVPRKQYVWLDYSEIEKFLSVIKSPRDRAIIACLWSTGCRISELLSLNRNDIHNNEAQIIGKGDRLGTVYFDERSLQLLEDYLNTRTDRLRPLFISGQYRRISVGRVEQLVHTYEDMAGFDKNITPHVFRHSYATDLYSNGADIYAISKSLRHSQIASTQIYTHVNDKYNKKTHEMYHST